MTAGPAAGTSSRLVPIPPDGGWGWVVVVGSFLIHVFADGFAYSFGVLVDVLMKVKLYTLIFHEKIEVVLAQTSHFYGCTLSSFATAMWHIVFSVGVIMGVGFGLMYCPAIVIVTMYFETRRSLATGIAVAGAGVGTVLFSPINEFIISKFGWRAVFYAFLGELDHNYTLHILW
ncbi:hypothetical protein ANCCAN_19328 [Ancylostoma caninum]|uniref:Major facilitator superfamily (MFS) profile domain-containing protein n=1 Tax=Ancylostoma caninum TaxID=29170 RepID=A0A368FRG9_ANCCA|nr:hypothetical protein ANCCAN_19328 [Ancylostoma caninum]